MTRILPRGVYLRKNGRFRAMIRLNGVQVYLGDFETPEEASEVFQKKRREIPAKHKWGYQIRVQKDPPPMKPKKPITIRVDPARLTPDQRMGLAILLSERRR